ncbi:MAG: hypothetical protein LAO56_22325 [Acidobacteriia bacterium]|nr:hypothetical protein [Terriglobia bacterium]
MKNRNQRKKRKAAKKRQSSRWFKNKFVSPQTVEEFFAMSEPHQDLWKNIAQAVTEVRAGASLRQASRKFDLDPRKVSQLARPALRKLRNGRWAAKTYDCLLRVLVIPTRKGLHEVGMRDSRQATLLGKYWTAVERYRDTGDASALREFRGKHIIDASGKRVRLLTNLGELDRLGSAGVLSFETLYAKVA